jgi:hypothetical protein
MRLHRAEQQDDLMRKRLAAQQNESKCDAAKAFADRDTAVAELQKTERIIQEMKTIRASTHAIKIFTLAALSN